MKLKDFYFADRHETGSRMPILLPDGTDSGEWLQVRGPDCDEAIQAGRAYTLAIQALDDSLTDVEAKCKDKEDFTEWNVKRSWGVEPLNKQLAAALVTGWSMDETFTAAAFTELLDQFRGLAEQVSAHHIKSRDELNAK